MILKIDKILSLSIVLVVVVVVGVVVFACLPLQAVTNQKGNLELLKLLDMLSETSDTVDADLYDYEADELLRDYESDEFLNQDEKNEPSPPEQSKGVVSIAEAVKISMDLYEARNRVSTAKMIKRVNQWENHIRSRLDVSDEEWGVILPCLVKIMNNRLIHYSGRSLGLKGGPPTAYIKTGHKLYLLMTGDKKVSNDVIKKAIQDHYDAREEESARARADMKELRELLTTRQEALLIIMNFLD